MHDEHTAGRGFDPPDDLVAFLIDSIDADLNFRMQRDDARVERLLNLAGRPESHSLARFTLPL